MTKDSWHKAQYDTVRLGYPERNLPEWSDLPEDKKEDIRKINLDHQKWMNTLGSAISSGAGLPKNFL